MKKVVVFATEWPAFTSGSGIAIATSLIEYQKYFDEVRFFRIGGGCVPAEVGVRFPGVTFQSFPAPKMRPAVRFILSLPFAHPAIIGSFRSRRVVRAADSVLSLSWEEGYRYLVVESLATFGAVSRSWRHKFKTAFRSFDVMQKAFCGVGTRVTQPLWDFESQRIRAFEGDVFDNVSCFWAISKQDCEDFRSLGMKVDGVLGVAIDAQRYADVPAGDSMTATHLGSADERKKQGLLELVAGWEKVRARFPAARLFIGGKGTERYSRPHLGVVGCGYVKNDVEFFGRGKVAISSQIGGSGVKLKSLTALSAARVLVSTPDGLRGCGGKENEDYLVYDGVASFAEKVEAAFLGDMTVMRESARRHVRNNFSQETVEKEVGRSLQRFAS